MLTGSINPDLVGSHSTSGMPSGILAKGFLMTARAWGGIIEDSAPRGSVDGVVRTS